MNNEIIKSFPELPMKAYLIRTSFVTRVEVPTDYNEDAILAAANAKMIQTLNDDGIFEHVEEIVDDLECPAESEPEHISKVKVFDNLADRYVIQTSMGTVVQAGVEYPSKYVGDNLHIFINNKWEQVTGTDFEFIN